MIRRLRCVFRQHQWQPDPSAKRANRFVCARCGAHVTASIGTQAPDPQVGGFPGGGGGGDVMGGGDGS